MKNFNKAIKNFSYVDWVLDAGCGTGLITYQLKKPVVCLDINAWNLTRVKNRLKDSETVQADIEQLPFRDGCFEIIISTEVLEHVPNPAKAVKKIKRVLGDGGLFMGTVPSTHPVWRLRRYFLTTCPVSEPFHKSYTGKQLMRLLSGFKVDKLGYIMLGMSLFFLCRKT